MNVLACTTAQYACTTTCYKAFSASIAEDLAELGASHNESFYATAKNFTGSVPGDILKFGLIELKELSGSVPEGITAYQIQYTSASLSLETVPATGFVTFTYAKRTNGHICRTVAWAHRTSGVFKACALSAILDRYDYGIWSYLIERGYAVIATDHASLCNSFTGHPYSAPSAHANDVFYSVHVAAARKIFWLKFIAERMSTVHSEAGGTVWSLAESPLLRKSPNIAGNYL